MPNQNSGRDRSAQSSFAYAPAIVVFVCLECLVIVQALLAWQDHILTLSQMRQAGIEQGLPFVWHFAMWGDLLIVSGLASYIIGRYSFIWDIRKILFSFVLGFALATVLSWTYTFSGIYGAHVQNHSLTIIGVIHLVYMAIALAVFIQFFFFTTNVSMRLLRMTCILIFVHVFVGTHMVLGIINAISPLDWYPDQPLRSIFGWLILATIVLGLIWRNVGSTEIFAWIKTAYHFISGLVMWITHNKTQSSEGYLRFLNYGCGFALGAVYFFKSGWSSLKSGEISMSAVLLVVLGIVYYLSLLSVKQELDITKLVFPTDRVPNEFNLKDRVKITIKVILFTGLYILLGLYAHNILITSFCMFVVACIDWNTRKEINERMLRYFSDTNYSPQENDPAYKSIMEYRYLINWYLYQLPHLWKEKIRIAGCAVSFLVAIYGYFNHSKWLNNSAYLILIGTLILNEIVTNKWRWNRHNRLKKVKAGLTP